MGLNNMDAYNTIGSLEPQKQNHYLLRIPGLPFPNSQELLELAVTQGSIGNESFEDIAIPHLNGKVYHAGAASLETNQVTFRDYIDLNARKALEDWWGQHRDPATGKMSYKKTYCKQAFAILLDPTGEEKRKYAIKNIWMQSFDRGSFDHGSSDQVIISVTFRFDAIFPDKVQFVS